jgi:hypothetical protein
MIPKAAERQPEVVCNGCGTLFGRYMRPDRVSSYWMDTCGVCGKHMAVTEPRDFGYLKEGWEMYGK